MPSRRRSVCELPLGWNVRGLMAGVDEAGRGPLAGPVVAAAVILDPHRPIAGLADSKTLTPARRETLFDEILAKALCHSIASASAAEIDRLNILQATMLAMQRAVRGLRLLPALVLVDGNRLPILPMAADAVVRGDALVPAISAASILAKVHRDRLCVALHEVYPQYGFAGHKGYPTASHLAALQEHGPCPEHRRSFAPVALKETPGRPKFPYPPRGAGWAQPGPGGGHESKKDRSRGGDGQEPPPGGLQMLSGDAQSAQKGIQS